MRAHQTQHLLVVGPFSPGRLARAVKAARAELLERLLPPRRRRASPRVIKRKVASWPLKRVIHRVADRPRIPAITIVGATNLMYSAMKWN
ncbi:hypothetical protein [Streptomyces sp. CA-106110]|uniref:hypothetical protein n=1 Tax=Streptomyces sp. CA-106110 TaxID=3240044 RepID=UPI003D92BD9C